MSFDERVTKLKRLQRGWIIYFRLGNIGSKLKTIDSWVRNRLRYCIWTDCLKEIPLGEETRAETKELDSSGSPKGQGLCM